MIKLDVFRNNHKKKNLSGDLEELFEELRDKIYSVHRYCINSVYILCKDSFHFFKGWCEIV